MNSWTALSGITCGCYLVTLLGSEDEFSANLCGYHADKATQHGFPIGTPEQVRAAYKHIHWGRPSPRIDIERDRDHG